jgi:hypothetical protein
MRLRILDRTCIAGLLIVAAGAATAQSGTQESITYKGVPLGTSMTEFNSRFPDFSCTPAQGTCAYQIETCRGFPSGSTESDTAAFNRRGRECEERNSFGGAHVAYATASFQDDRLFRLLLSVPSGEIPALAASAAQRFGPSVSRNLTPIWVRGRPLPNLYVHWKVGSSVLVVQQQSRRPGFGEAEITTVEHFDARRAPARALIEKGAKDF